MITFFVYLWLIIIDGRANNDYSENKKKLGLIYSFSVDILLCKKKQDNSMHYFTKGKMKLYIKFMVSIRCKMVVQSELDKLGLEYGAIDLGEVDLKSEISSEQLNQLKMALSKSGLELMDNRKAVLVEKIKAVIIEMVHYADEPIKINFSDFLSDKLNFDYTYLANLFSEATGITIEHYIIRHKIERVKELLIYDELNLTEISYKLNYSSVGHLSNQFKKVTGLTPTFFKQLKTKRLSTLDNV